MPVKIKNKDTLIVKTDKGKQEITREDINNYYKTQSGSMSGLRQLGGISGDWRMIDAIASDVGTIFNIMK